MSKYTKDYMITMKDIVREGAPLLRQVTAEVALPPTQEDQEALIAMLNYLKNSQNPEIAATYHLRAGWGLSANQINLDRRMFAVYMVAEDGTEHEYMLFNPKIISHSTAMVYLSQGEGCLSVDREVLGYVPRYEKVKVRAYDINGNEVNLRFKGLLSIIIQHEIDHLNGIMFYDHINKDQPFQLPGNINISSVS